MPNRVPQRGIGYQDASGVYVGSNPITLVNRQCAEGQSYSDIIETAGFDHLRLTLTSSANSGTSPTANVYLQTSVCGQIWRTLHSFTQIGSTPYTAVTSAGTAPPTITLTGTPNITCYAKIKVKCTLGGARGTWTGAVSFDDGATYDSTFTSAATVNVLSASGGITGIVLNIATGSANVDNTWSFETTSPQRVTIGTLDRYTRAAVVVGGSSTPTHTLNLSGEISEI